MEDNEVSFLNFSEKDFVNGGVSFKYFQELNSRLANQKNLNIFLESQNVALKAQGSIPPKKTAPDYSVLANQYGPELANSIKTLVNENDYLKRSLERSYRETASLHSGISDLNSQLRDIKRKVFNTEYPDIDQQGTDKHSLNHANYESGTANSFMGSNTIEDKAEVVKSLTVEGGCKCTEVLEKLIKVVDDDLNNYHNYVWQHRVSSAESERDETLAKNAILIEQLVDLQTQVRQDPFRDLNLNDKNGKVDAHLQKRLLTAYKELAVSQNLNLDLERRLNFEQNISRSWQLNLKALQHELRDHFDDLSKASQLSGPFCSLYMGTIGAQPAGEKASVNSLTRTEKESIKMLRKARDRIEGDSERIKVYNHRIKNLEEEVALLRKMPDKELVQDEPGKAELSVLFSLYHGKKFYNDEIIFNHIINKLRTSRKILENIKSSRENSKDEFQNTRVKTLSNTTSNIVTLVQTVQNLRVLSEGSKKDYMAIKSIIKSQKTEMLQSETYQSKPQAVKFVSSGLKVPEKPEILASQQATRKDQVSALLKESVSQSIIKQSTAEVKAAKGVEPKSKPDFKKVIKKPKVLEVKRGEVKVERPEAEEMSSKNIVKNISPPPPSVDVKLGSHPVLELNKEPGKKVSDFREGFSISKKSTEFKKSKPLLDTILNDINAASSTSFEKDQKKPAVTNSEVLIDYKSLNKSSELYKAKPKEKPVLAPATKSIERSKVEPSIIPKAKAKEKPNVAPPKNYSGSDDKTKISTKSKPLFPHKHEMVTKAPSIKQDVPADVGPQEQTEIDPKLSIGQRYDRLKEMLQKDNKLGLTSLDDPILKPKLTSVDLLKEEIAKTKDVDILPKSVSSSVEPKQEDLVDKKIDAYSARKVLKDVSNNVSDVVEKEIQPKNLRPEVDNKVETAAPMEEDKIIATSTTIVDHRKEIENESEGENEQDLYKTQDLSSSQSSEHNQSSSSTDQLEKVLEHTETSQISLSSSASSELTNLISKDLNLRNIDNEEFHQDESIRKGSNSLDSSPRERFRSVVIKQTKKSSVKSVFLIDDPESIILRGLCNELDSKGISLAEAYREMKSEVPEIKIEQFKNFLSTNSMVSIPKDKVESVFQSLTGGEVHLELAQFYQKLGQEVNSALRLGERLTEVYFSIRDAFKELGHLDDYSTVKKNDFVELCSKIAVKASVAKKLFEKMDTDEDDEVLVNELVRNLSGSGDYTVQGGDSWRQIVGRLKASHDFNRQNKIKRFDSITHASYSRSASGVMDYKHSNAIAQETQSQVFNWISELEESKEKQVDDELDSRESIIKKFASLRHISGSSEEIIQPFCHSNEYDATTDDNEENLDSSSEGTSEASSIEDTQSSVLFDSNENRDILTENVMLIKEKLLKKYGHCSNAFRFMDDNNNGNVTIHEFANFLEEMGFEYSFRNTCSLYDELCKPVSGRLTLSSLYRNLEGDNCSFAGLNSRFEEIYGNPKIPLLEISESSRERISLDQFIQISAKVGMSYSNAVNLWNTIDIFKYEFMSLSDVESILEGSNTVEELVKKQKSQGNVFNMIFNTFSAPTDSPQRLPTDDSSAKIPTGKLIKQGWGIEDNYLILDNVIETTYPWDALRFSERSRVLKFMRLSVLKEDSVVQEQSSAVQDLIVLENGKLMKTSTSFFFNASSETISSPCVVANDEFLKGKTQNFTLVVPQGESEARVWILRQSDYIRDIKQLLERRIEEVGCYESFLSSCAVIHKLSTWARRKIAINFECKYYSEGTSIFRKFDEPDYFYIIKSGKAVVISDKNINNEFEEYRVYQKGDYFGELSIIKKQTRSATVIAKTDCECLSLDVESFDRLLMKLNEDFILRAEESYKSISNLVETYKRMGNKKKSKKKKAERKKSHKESLISISQLNEAEDEEMTSHKLIRIEKQIELDELMLIMETVPIIKLLSKEKRKHIVQDMELEIYYPNVPIVIEGEEPDKFYILKSGTVSVELYQGPGLPLKPVKDYSSAEYFGEMSFIKQEKRTAYIISKTPVHTYSLKKDKFFFHLEDQFESFIERAKLEYRSGSIIEPQDVIEMKRESFSTLDFSPFEFLEVLKPLKECSDLDDSKLEQVIREIRKNEFQIREIIVEQGVKVQRLLIVAEGVISLEKHNPITLKIEDMGTLEKGSILCLDEFKNGVSSPCAYVAKINSKILSLDKLRFQEIFGEASSSSLQPTIVKTPKASKKYKEPPPPKPISEQDDEVEINENFIKNVEDEEEIYIKKLERRSSRKMSADLSDKENYPNLLSRQNSDKISLLQSEDLPSTHQIYNKNEEMLDEHEASSVPNDQNLLSLYSSSFYEASYKDLMTLKHIRVNMIQKYNSLEEAYNQMVVEGAENVDFKGFSTFLRSLEIVPALKVREKRDVFKLLCGDHPEGLTLTNFIKRMNVSINHLMKNFQFKAEECHGTVSATIHSIKRSDNRIFTHDFTCIGPTLGLESSTMQTIWDYINPNGERSLETEEVVKRISDFKLDPQFEDDVVPLNSEFEERFGVQKDDHKNFPDECKALKTSLKSLEVFSNLSDEQLRYIVSLTRRELWVSGSRPVKQEPFDIPLIWVYSGELDILQSGFLGFETKVSTVATKQFVGIDQFLQDEKYEFFIQVPVNRDAIIWSLEREVFSTNIKDMLKERNDNFPKIFEFLSSSVLFQKASTDKIKMATQACKLENIRKHQYITKMGRTAQAQYIIYVGKAELTAMDESTGAVVTQAILERKSFFGQINLFEVASKKTNIKAIKNAQLISWSRSDFEQIFDYLITDKKFINSDDGSTEESNKTSQPAFKKGDRKSSLALSAYQKLRGEKSKSTEENVDSDEDGLTAMWQLAPDPDIIHTPPDSDTKPLPSCLSPQNKRRKAFNVNFDESTLLPHESSDEEIYIHKIEV